VFFTMPFIEGESLRERLRREKRLSIDEALRITSEVASALEYAHARRIVHRDVKPENILLSTNGHAFVADFGVAYALDEARSTVRTDPGFAVGTLVYMSPEEMEGQRQLDGRADLYSLACVLYEMLAGSPPFPGGARRPAPAAGDSRDTIPSVLTARPEVPAAVDRALTHALARVPEHRFATMAEFTAALRSASCFEISTLGGLTVRADGRPIRGDRLTPNALACLALLAHAGDRGVPRERLEALVWEAAAESDAPSEMKETLTAIHSELGQAVALVGESVIQLDPSLVDSDIDRFGALVRAERLGDAVAEYRGPFLEGFRLANAPAFAKWVEHTRAELAFEYAVVLERLARDAEARGDHADAVRWWHKLAGQDPLNGRLTISLMRALAAAGDRSGAIEQASIYEALIEEEVELPLDRGVVDFAERLRAGWDPGGGDAEALSGETAGLEGGATAVETMQADADGPSARARVGFATLPPATGSGPRAHIWRRAFLLALVALVVLAAFWLLGAQPTPSRPTLEPAPNGPTAALGHGISVRRPSSGNGAR
jgi:DNA-binding SARP family transcriptional activator